MPRNALTLVRQDKGCKPSNDSSPVYGRYGSKPRAGIECKRKPLIIEGQQ